jgi:hypothetical protein
VNTKTFPDTKLASVFRPLFPIQTNQFSGETKQSSGVWSLQSVNGLRFTSLGQGLPRNFHTPYSSSLPFCTGHIIFTRRLFVLAHDVAVFDVGLHIQIRSVHILAFAVLTVGISTLRAVVAMRCHIEPHRERCLNLRYQMVITSSLLKPSGRDGVSFFLFRNSVVSPGLYHYYAKAKAVPL